MQSSPAPLDHAASRFSLRELPMPLVCRGAARTSDWEAFGDLLGGELQARVVQLHGLLRRDNRHFGYRLANEIARFVTLAAKQAEADEPTLWTALDLAILQKVLPKFHGTEQEMKEPLTALFGFAIFGRTDAADEWIQSELKGGELYPKREVEMAVPPQLPRTAAKLWRMLLRLKQQGFTSFVE